MVDIIKNLNPNIRLGITTNCSQDLTRFVNEIPPTRLVNMTLSYHPSQQLSRDAFLGKALMLKHRGYPININFVSYTEQIWLAQELKEYFEGKYGIRFHVDPYATNPLFPCPLTEAEQNFIKPFVGQDRQYRFGSSNNHARCSAGHDYLVLQPDGSVFRCMSFVWNEKGAMGNIFDPNFKIFDAPRECDSSGSCGGCDRDKVTIEAINDKA